MLPGGVSGIKLACQCKNAILGFRRKLEAGDVDSVIGLYVVYVLGEHRIIREDNCDTYHMLV